MMVYTDSDMIRWTCVQLTNILHSQLSEQSEYYSDTNDYVINNNNYKYINIYYNNNK